MQAYRAPARPRESQLANRREISCNRRAAGVAGVLVELLLKVNSYEQDSQSNWL